MKRFLLCAGLLTISCSACSGEKEKVDAELITQQGPYYPYDMQAKMLGGKVVLLMDIDKRGHTMNCTIFSSTEPGFNKSALDYCKKERFVPATEDDRVVVEHNHRQRVKYDPGQ